MMKKRTSCIILLVVMLGLCACGREGVLGGSPQEETQANQTEPMQESVTEPVQEPSVAKDMEEFVLTEKGKDFLLGMCLCLPEFSSAEDMDAEFWDNFIFFGFTSTGDAEYVPIYRESLGYEELDIKVSREEVEKYAMLALGVSIPDNPPSFDDFEAGRSFYFYQDGYYYIGASDFPDESYFYKGCSVSEKDGHSVMVVEFGVCFEDEESAWTISFTISPAENENGFIILGKMWKMEPEETGEIDFENTEEEQQAIYYERYYAKWDEDEMIAEMNNRRVYLDNCSFYEEANQFIENVLGNRDISSLVEPLFPLDMVLMEKEDFEDFPPLMIHILKNEIYAMHGYIFQNEDLDNYFRGMLWYTPQYEAGDFDDSVFNEIERHNLEILAQLDTY